MDVVAEDALAPIYFNSVPIMSGLELTKLDFGLIWAELSLSYNINYKKIYGMVLHRKELQVMMIRDFNLIKRY